MKQNGTIVFILWFLSFGFTIACTQKKERHDLSEFDISEILTQSGDTSSRNRTFRSIVNQISTYDRVDGALIGVGATQSAQHRRFLWLKKFATNDELFRLADNPNVNVRVYAFMALHDRDIRFSRQILEQRLSDTAYFKHLSGCIQMPERINVFYLNYLSGRLSFSEIKTYKKEISKYYSDKSWEDIQRPF